MVNYSDRCNTYYNNLSGIEKNKMTVTLPD